MSTIEAQRYWHLAGNELGRIISSLGGTPLSATAAGEPALLCLGEHGAAIVTISGNSFVVHRVRRGAGPISIRESGPMLAESSDRVCNDRQAMQGILFVLHTGIAWRHLPLELGFGSGSTCYRRLDEWQRAGVWERLHALLLAELRAAGGSSGRGRSPTRVIWRRKRGLRDGPEPG